MAVPRSVTVAAEPGFHVAPSPTVLAALDRARLRLWDASSDSLLAFSEASIDPDRAEWTFELTLELLTDQELDVRLEVELIDADPVVDRVEFAGLARFGVQASFGVVEIREIGLGRGPLENLSLTHIAVGGARSRIQEGGSDALEVDTLGAAAGQVVFFHSTEPTVASVDSVGAISALAPGSTLIIAAAGRVADTLALTVGEVNLPTAQALRRRLVPQIEYVTSDPFLRSLSDRSVATELRDALQQLLAEMLAGNGPQAVHRFENVEGLWASYGAGTELRSFERAQLSVIELTLMHAADALGIDF